MFPKRAPRVYSNDLNEYKLELSLQIAGSDFFGILGDLSASGLCAVIPLAEGDLLATEIGGEIFGSVLSPEMEEELRFEATVAWQEVADFKGKHSCMIGLEFSGEMQLPYVLRNAIQAADL